MWMQTPRGRGRAYLSFLKWHVKVSYNSHAGLRKGEEVGHCTWNCRVTKAHDLRLFLARPNLADVLNFFFSGLWGYLFPTIAPPPLPFSYLSQISEKKTATEMKSLSLIYLSLLMSLSLSSFFFFFSLFVLSLLLHYITKLPETRHHLQQIMFLGVTWLSILIRLILCFGAA